MAIIDLIEYPNEMSNELVHREPEDTSGEFRLGSQLVVRESQRAVFFRDGKALDVFGPGRHTLSTNNIPLLTGLIGLPFGGSSPFRSEVYFVSMREFTDLKWGSAQPLVYRDAELGMIRLRAHGTYSIRVSDPQVLVGQIVGARGSYSTAQIDEFLRSIILNQFNDLLGDVHTSILDLQGMTKEVADAARATLAEPFRRYGLDLTSFQINAITPPDEVMARIDERSGMAALGDMGEYTRFRTAQAIGDAANNPGTAGDITGAGVGLGAGLGIGQAMSEAMRQSQQPAAAPAQPQAATEQCPNCQATIAAGSNSVRNVAPTSQASPARNAGRRTSRERSSASTAASHSPDPGALAGSLAEGNEAVGMMPAASFVSGMPVYSQSQHGCDEKQGRHTLADPSPLTPLPPEEANRHWSAPTNVRR